MRKIIRLAGVVGFLISTLAPSAQADASLTGLWSGVDNVDGSLRTVSISDLDGDGVFTVLSHDTYWSLCDGDRGFGETSGKVGKDGAIFAVGKVKCYSGKNVDFKVHYIPVGAPPGAMIMEDVLDKPFDNLLYRINVAPTAR